jgi:hypothetical protein
VRFFFLSISLCVLASTYAQKPKYLSLEALGSGGLASLNYEQGIIDKDIFDMHFRTGLSFAPIDKNNGTAIIFPLMVHGLLGSGNHKLDLGLGQALTVTTRGSFFLRMPASVGYRFEPIDKRYYLRASYTPIVSYLFNFQWEHWGGLTFGYRLTK